MSPEWEGLLVLEAPSFLLLHSPPKPLAYINRHTVLIATKSYQHKHPYEHMTYVVL